jgi:PAS domain S-box-containing protein
MTQLSEPVRSPRLHPSEPKANILLVDDNPTNLFVLRTLLDELDQNLVETQSGEEALRGMLTQEFAVVLLDVFMPGMSGFETARLIRGSERFRHTPIIFLTASNLDQSQIIEGYALGAVDFLVKPLDAVILRAKVRGFIELFQEKQHAAREADQLRQLIDATADYAIFMLDTEGYILTWNSGAERLKGHRAHEIIGQHFSRFYPQEAIDKGWPEYELKVARQEGRFEDEGWRVRQDGSQFWANVVITALRDKSGNQRGFSKITRDITERKKADENARRLLEETTARRVAETSARLIQDQQDELRLSEQELSDFFENATVGLHWVGSEGTILRANQAELDLLGFTAEEYIGQPIAQFHADEDVIGDILKRLQAGERLAEYPARLRCKDGSIKDVLIDSSGLFKDDQFVHTRCFTRDITERKRAEGALAESEERYRATLDQAAIGVAHVGLNQRTLWANPGLCAMLGYTEVEILERSFLELTHHEDLETDLGLVKRVLSGEIPSYRIEKRYLHKSGKVVWGDLAVSAVRDASGGTKYLIGVVVDITQRKRLEDELRSQAAELRDADRRKDEFLATLAHELRNPLAPIRNSLQILKMPGLNASTSQLTREMIERQVHHLVRLVDDLLDVSRVMRGKIELRKEPVELATVVARAIETARPMIDAQEHQLEISLPSESLLLHADSVRLAQTLGNVLINAAKYTEPRGHIWLSAERESDQAVLKIRDTGIGISQDLLPHIFELFVQADHASTKAQGGLGIGLTLVKNLTELHKGTVEAYSEGAGKGSEFVIRLPLMPQPASSPKDQEIPEQNRPIASSSHRLLVVDDNQDAANSLTMLLRMQGHAVQVAHSGPTALEIAADFGPDIIFLDIGMPGMDGYEVARRVRTMPGLEKTVLVALTGWGQSEDRRRTAEAGFNHHLVKPPEMKSVEGILTTLESRS